MTEHLKRYIQFKLSDFKMAVHTQTKKGMRHFIILFIHNNSAIL